MSSEVWTVPADIEVRFAEKVLLAEDCWLWLGARSSTGYGVFRAYGRVVKAHGFAYERFVDDVPKGLELDHLCNVRHCVNPDHLEPVTHTENVARGVTRRRRNECLSSSV